MDIARYSPDGQPLGGEDHAAPPAAEGSTASTSTRPSATRTARARPAAIDPELRSIARWQAARYAGTCRIFAPVYRQVTLAGPDARRRRPTGARAYRDVRAAWRAYLKRHNHGRGVVLIGHSQGTFHLRDLLAEEIEPRPKRAPPARVRAPARRERHGRARAATPAATSATSAPAARRTQIGCVVAFSTYNAPGPRRRRRSAARWTRRCRCCARTRRRSPAARRRSTRSSRARRSRPGPRSRP